MGLNFDVEQIVSTKPKDRDIVLQEIEATSGFKALNQRFHTKAAGPAVREAARNGDLNALQEIIAKCDGLDITGPRMRGVEGVSVLHVATSEGHPRVVRALLAMKADPDEQDLGGETPLHFAA